MAKTKFDIFLLVDWTIDFQIFKFHFTSERKGVCLLTACEVYLFYTIQQKFDEIEMLRLMVQPAPPVTPLSIFGCMPLHQCLALVSLLHIKFNSLSRLSLHLVMGLPRLRLELQGVYSSSFFPPLKYSYFIKYNLHNVICLRLFFGLCSHLVFCLFVLHLTCLLLSIDFRVVFKFTQIIW